MKKEHATTVAMCPTTAGNPYMRNLINELCNQGVNAHGISRGLPIHYRSAHARAANILHFHWPDAYYSSNSKIKMRLKSVAFQSELNLAKLSLKKIVWTAHNLLPHDVGSLDLHKKIMANFARKCDAILAHSHAAKTIISDSFEVDKRKITVVPHSHYIDDYPNTTTRKASREKLNLNESDFVFLFAGSLRKYKGISELLEAFSNLKRPGCRLVLAGTPFDREVAEEIETHCRQNSNITCTNQFVAAEDMQIFMAAADVVVLPHRRPFTSGTLYLAASFAKVAIVPDIQTITSCVSPSGTIKFDLGSEDGLTRAMALAFHERESLAIRGQESQESIREWNWSKMADSTRNTYDRLTSER